MVKQRNTYTRRSDWLRWTLPPGVSIAVHATLIGIIALVGMRISAQEPTRDKLPLAELALAAPSVLPEITKPDLNTPDSSPQQPSTTPAAPIELEHAAADLGGLNLAKPAMDPIALAALRSSNAQIARPQSAMPPTVRFAGVQTRAARSIVYVVDGSGATANSFAYLQTQLLRSIDRLSPTQQFQVVLFRSFDTQRITLAPINNAKLARATPKHKQRVADWLSTISARGRSNPVDGLRSALALKPDLVLLITRSIERTEMGWAQGQRAILDELNTLNPQNPKTGKRPTTIKTIQLLDEDPTGVMRAIGTFHGDGTDDYRVVTYDDLISPDQGNELDEINARSIGASNEQRISSASELMGALTQSGISFSVFYSYADAEQRTRTLRDAKQIRSMVHQLIEVDGRAAILDAQATLMIQIAGSHIQPAPLNAIIASLDGVSYTEPNTDAQRVLTLALAMDLLGDRANARARVAGLLEISDDLGLDGTTRAQGALALVSMGVEPRVFHELAIEPPFVTPNGSIDAVWGLLLRETETKARLDADGANPWGAMIAIRQSARNASGTSRAISNYIDTRITLILNSIDTEQLDTALPSEVLLAAANTMSHTIEGRERAIELLGEISERSNEPQQAADALWQIGVLGYAINTTDARARSASALFELAQRHPLHDRAPDAIAGAIHATPARDKNLLRDRLALGVEQFPTHPQIDLWRLDLAELLTDFALLDVLDPIAPETREGVLAGELYERTVLSMLDRYTDPQIRYGLGVRMLEAARRFEIPSVLMWTKRVAMSEVELDPQAAIGSIDRLILEAQQQHQPIEELELLRAQTLNGLGQTRLAFKALSELSARIDATGNHTSTYWQAWALMLEAIAQSGSAPDKADAIRHIARLELIDSNLGGSPWAQRIIAARGLLHSSP